MLPHEAVSLSPLEYDEKSTAARYVGCLAFIVIFSLIRRIHVERLARKMKLKMADDVVLCVTHERLEKRKKP